MTAKEPNENNYIDAVISYFNDERKNANFIYQMSEQQKGNAVTVLLTVTNLVFLSIMAYIALFSPLVSSSMSAQYELTAQIGNNLIAINNMQNSNFSNAFLSYNEALLKNLNQTSERNTATQNLLKDFVIIVSVLMVLTLVFVYTTKKPYEKHMEKVANYGTLLDNILRQLYTIKMELKTELDNPEIREKLLMIYLPPEKYFENEQSIISKFLLKKN